MKRYGNKYYSSFSQIKVTIAELVIRTLTKNLFKYISLNRTDELIDIMPKIVRNYNNDKVGYSKMKHSVVKYNTVLTIYNHPRIAGARKLKVGVILRIRKAKHIFDKVYTPTWTTNLYKIANVNNTKPVTYLYAWRPLRCSNYGKLLRVRSSNGYQ